MNQVAMINSLLNWETRCPIAPKDHKDQWAGSIHRGFLSDNAKFVLITTPEGLDQWEAIHPQIIGSKTKNGIHEIFYEKFFEPIGFSLVFESQN